MFELILNLKLMTLGVQALQEMHIGGLPSLLGSGGESEVAEDAEDEKQRHAEDLRPDAHLGVRQKIHEIRRKKHQ